jgi:hypothetical protein
MAGQRTFILVAVAVAGHRFVVLVCRPRVRPSIPAFRRRADQEPFLRLPGFPVVVFRL